MNTHNKRLAWHRTALLATAAAALALGGCASHHEPRQNRAPVYEQGGYPPSGSYPGSGGPSQAPVQYGHVRSIEQIEGGGSSGGGALIGGVIGGALGNQVGKGSGRAAATVAGAVGGAVVGNEIERQRSGRTRYEVLVQLERRGAEQWFELGQLDGLKVGDRVRIENGRLYRW
ncbi:glycine zipper 2TM domain-containing protein [Roseateles sp. DAIF2]|uniref:glycine zipper 2TM domain-containing protein n=1 Tax=Roseateles sp. DAIF2 TaxID=2714952 RepID=UPI0018A2C241|nr:glycine zipper 2TM domain-containing protein [Roseateles sp. DAIF2]QPF74975.1 glycine zipper 2TM domain-containing protein [Roseateles sp. DAIF2]